MEKYIAPAARRGNPKPLPRHRWKRNAFELDGRICSGHRHEASQLLLDSYAETRVFEHRYHIGGDCCPTHVRILHEMARIANMTDGDSFVSITREGISGLEFDSKGIYLASVTRSGCLTVHDFETMYCMTYGPPLSLQKGNRFLFIRTGLEAECQKSGIHQFQPVISGSLEDETRLLLHIATSQTLDVVRWNISNQDEVACASRQNNKILLFDIGYESSEPVQVLEKPKLSGHKVEPSSGLSDLTFTSADKSRLLASGLNGCIYMWDRRLGNLPCVELINNSQNQLNSIQLDVDDRIVFGASKNGIIYAWDLRGGRASFAFQSHKEVYYPLLSSVKVSALLEKIPSLKAQSNILPREIHSINFDPSCSSRLAFHLDDGWSGVLDINNFNVTHMHCPPPAWLDGAMSTSYSDLRKPSWLPLCSIYAVASSYNNGIYLLDFYPGKNSACHVNFSEELLTVSEEYEGTVQNSFVPVSQSVSVCAAHPLNGTIIAGTKIKISEFSEMTMLTDNWCSSIMFRTNFFNRKMRNERGREI